MPRIFDKIRRIAAIRKSSGTIHLTNFSPCVIICLPLCYMAFSYNMTTVVKQLKVWRGAQLASPLSAVACSLFPIGLGVRNFLRCAALRGNPKINASNRNGGDCKCNRRRFSYSLFSVFPSILPFPRGTFAHRSRPRKVPSSKSAVIRRGRYRISPKRGWARWSHYIILESNVAFYLVIRIK